MGISIEFDQKVCEAIRCYVYALRDPQTRSIFYVGKGVGNRCFKHIKAARDNVPDTEKLKTIRDLLDKGIGVDIDIVRHGLDEATALEVEAALIDVLELVCDGNNEVAGYGVKRGLKPAAEIQIFYGAKPLVPKEPLLLIKINKQWQPGMTIDEVYNAVRWCWRMDMTEAEKAHYVLAVAHGIVRGVFKWTEFKRITASEAEDRKDPKANGRVYFNGYHVDSEYLHTSTKEFVQPGEQTPIRYVGPAA